MTTGRINQVAIPFQTSAPLYMYSFLPTFHVGIMSAPPNLMIVLAMVITQLCPQHILTILSPIVCSQVPNPFNAPIQGLSTPTWRRPHHVPATLNRPHLHPPKRLPFPLGCFGPVVQCDTTPLEIFFFIKAVPILLDLPEQP